MNDTTTESIPEFKQDYATAARTVAIASGKGGTGKSIIISSIGALLAHCGFKVLLVDTDVFTAGLSFYLLGQNPRRVRLGLQDIFIKEAKYQDLKPVLISNTYTSGNLFLFPAVSKTKIDTSELRITPSFSMERLYNTLSGIKNLALNKLKFDFVLFDTRGGTDLTSITTCVAAEAFIMVTEADKTSWDLGEILIESINNASAELGKECLPLGFILNKNVLPSEAIEAFLRRRWGLPHLATLPLDEEAIRAFQTDEIPVISSPHSRFALGIVPVIRKAFFDTSWSEKQIDQLLQLEKTVERDVSQGKVDNLGRVTPHQKRTFTLKIYTIILSLLLLGISFYVDRFTNDPSTWFKLLVAASFIITIIVSLTDTEFVFSLVKLFFPKTLKGVINSTVNETNSAAVSAKDANSKYHVYISYSHGDSDFVHNYIIPFLNESKISYFYDQEVLIGAEWENALSMALTQSRFFIAVISNAYIQSHTASAELGVALSSKKRVIPILIDPNLSYQNLPYTISRLNILRMTSSDEIQEGFTRIRRVLHERDK